MKYMSSEEIRESFLRFFESKGHKILPSASLIPSDPQLLFTVAGMVPFKPIFWGLVEPTYPRVATCQKCLRTVDIENVGKTPRHNTFFEMLGNFSFGDYFKEEAILWAWEYVTEVLKIPPEKLWVSVYEEDEESYRIWKEKVGIPSHKIVRMGKEDNFWGPAGPTGPCGPDSEIFFDLGEGENCPDPENCTPACDCGRFLEIWNLVFTELYLDEHGEYHPLPKKNIDTGAGLERMTWVMQGVKSAFETDLFRPIITRIEELTGAGYGQSPRSDVSIRVLADHTRAMTFAIADGVYPSNEGRGYVLRRIIRRAVRHGYLLGLRNSFLHNMIDAVVEKMSPVYPELKEKRNLIIQVVQSEEERFFATIERGMEYLQKALEKGRVDAETAFMLYDTYGFPLDLTVEIAQEAGIEVDTDGFEEFMNRQRERARAARGEKEYAQVRKIYTELGDRIETEFVGYESLEAESEILHIIRNEEDVDNASTGEEVELVFSKTPFYAEKGGQVSDTGMILTDTGKATVLMVENPYKGLIVHRVKVEEGQLYKGQKAQLLVDKEKRLATARNHTATHLLHAALKKVLGEHVKQAGSLVAPDRLRFDFTHYTALNKEGILRVERLVNEAILKDLPVEIEWKSLDDALAENVVALFEEKYGDRVRVVKVKGVSAELCGGTHVNRTGEIGLFKITSESAVSAGVRRIEAITGFGSLEYLEKLESELKNSAQLLECGMWELRERLSKLLEEKKQLEKQLRRLESSSLSDLLRKAVEEAEEVNGVKIAYAVFDDMPQDVHRNAVDTLSSMLRKGIGIVFNRVDGKVSFVMKLSGDLKGTLNAGQLAKAMARVLGGGGGGRADFAQAGGKFPEKIPEAVKLLKELIQRG
ncbi:MAG: alanyl-tRNA synthetase [Thermotogota bacterium]|nr:alanyl-tRNA synthetase [Thermotogota bacterium]MDK2865047.1 alanyl-tRNA synthetase [Thermotogota bacterium]HCZ06007.1 alanine--tRNA ligase [Thermotogota bacterium]